MSDLEMMCAVLSAIVVALGVLAKAALAYVGSAKAVAKFAAVLPYAIMAAKWVERSVPDDYGADAEDPTTAKSLHKLDLFLAKFTELVEKMEGQTVDAAMRAEAVKWSATLAGRLSADPMAPIAAGAAVETVLKRVSRADFR